MERKVLLDKLNEIDDTYKTYIATYAVELSLYTGMRVGELAGLMWSNIDFERNTITIQRSEKYNRKTKEFVNERSIHAIRRTLNSNLRCIGVPVTIAAAILGHTEEVNEKNYTYDVSSMQKKAEYIEMASKIS